MIKTIHLRPIINQYNLPERFKTEFALLAAEHLHLPHSGTRVSGRSLSQMSQRQRLQALLAMFVELRSVGGMAVNSPYSIRQKHVRWLVQYWVGDRKLNAGTVELRLTHLRALMSWMGKTNVVGRIDDYVERPAGYARSYIAREDKSWEGKGIDAAAKIAEIEVTDAHVALQLKLEAAFGLRAMESWRLRPALDVLPSGMLHVHDGTKGGRPRRVPIEFGWQYELLGKAATLAYATNPEKGTLIPATYTQIRWRRRFYTVLEKHGVTKNGQGVTAHGLRHQFLQQMYQRESGQAAAVKGGGKVVDVQAHREAMRKVVEAAGHSRATKANAYLSTYATQLSIGRTDPTLEDVKAAIAAAGGNKAVAARELGISRTKLYRILAQEVGR
ncbi:Integrase domain-containing protein (plasmid) [Cupriavidus necator H16]|uniref:Fis family transcriptional regulator n=1 Tax=Cupriavidus necator (strain ATCC 17699 / DSM 428 / KCTC 22496 / NCIMB 10442 / H16 / Stanier 337) TaxID=381666 RepID=Q7WX13_CUPNH|nr:integrase domain-containing protein [Cupriavidus necator]AAP86078.1 putative regulatory protein [Cupriavidus necator H16]QCC05548.1 Fis family transcriptional regulator [Cupriavidus necator H16]QQB81371.1 integrase domain-containing protein [Cupriavidus necator]